MSFKRGALYLAALGLLGALTCLAWPRAPRGGVALDPGLAPGSGQRVASALAPLPRPTASSRRRVPVSGTVRDAATSKGLAGVVLRFKDSDGESRATSEAGGGYQLELPAGLYDVTLVAEEHAASQPRPTLLIQEDEPVSGLDFWLQRTGSLSGRVVDGQGRPIAGAEVIVQQARGPAQPQPDRAPARSDEKGRFSLRVPPGEVVLRADAARLGAALSRPVYVQAGMHVAGIELVLGGGGGLAGRVLDPAGAPARGAEVLLKDELGLRRLPCDAEGRFAASGVVPGTKQVQAAASGFAPSQVVELEVRPGPAENLVLRLGVAKAVAGRVLSPEGAPVAGARVSLRAGGPQGTLVQLAAARDVLTDESGSFRFSDVPSLPLTLTAHGPGNAVTTRAGVPPGSEDVVLRLEATGSIVGLVTAGQSGKPVTDFTVTLTSGPGVDAGHRPAWRVASARGQFSIDDLLPGRYALAITAPDHGPAEKGGLGVVAGMAARADVSMDAGGRIAGVVVDGRGVGVPGASVQVDTGWVGAAAVTDASGAFLVRDVAVGRRSLSVSHPQHNSRILGGVSVFAAQTTSVRVELTSSQGGKPGLNLTGIGATLTSQQGHLVVVQALPSSPAEVAGLRSGDKLVRIDEKESAKLSFAEAIEALRGIPGTPVRIRVLRGDQSFELYVIRGEIALPGK